MKMAYFFIVNIILVGCVYGPKQERKSPLNYLNGEHYEVNEYTAGNQLVLPVAKKKAKATHIRGALFVKEGILPVPLKFQVLVLTNKDGEILAETTSDSSGQFQFSEVLKNGDYLIQIQADKYEAKFPIDVQAYEINDLIVEAHRR